MYGLHHHNWEHRNSQVVEAVRSHLSIRRRCCLCGGSLCLYTLLVLVIRPINPSMRCTSNQTTQNQSPLGIGSGPNYTIHVVNHDDFNLFGFPKWALLKTEFLKILENKLRRDEKWILSYHSSKSGSHLYLHFIFFTAHIINYPLLNPLYHEFLKIQFYENKKGIQWETHWNFGLDSLGPQAWFVQPDILNIKYKCLQMSLVGP